MHISEVQSEISIDDEATILTMKLRPWADQ